MGNDDECSHESGSGGVAEKKKKSVQRMVVFILFQAVLQHVSALQSDVSLFSQALGGDEARTSQVLSATQAMVGILGLFLNQIGGKLSDSFGRRFFFMFGPCMNMASALAVIRNPTNITVLAIARVLRSLFTTFSGTVIATAALRDVCAGTEMAIMGTRIQTAVGVAVVAGPYLESVALKASNGSPVAPFKVLGALSCFQFLQSALLMPETIKERAKFNWAEVLHYMNPLGFLRVYFGEKGTLKKLFTAVGFQECMDGKVTSDLFQLWARNNLKWTSETTRDYAASWGAAVTGGAFFLHPYLLRKLGPYEYSTVGNLCVACGQMCAGLAERGICLWAGLPLLLPGVNGGSAHAIRALAVDLAVKEGYGIGEFSGWQANIKALLQSLQIVLVGTLYARCRQRGLYAGVVWFWVAFVGAAIPQLILSTMSKKEFEKSA